MSDKLVALLSSSFWCSRAKAERGRKEREREGSKAGRKNGGRKLQLGPTLKRRGGEEDQRRIEGRKEGRREPELS